MFKTSLTPGCLKSNINLLNDKPLLINEGIWIINCSIAPNKVATASTKPPFRASSEDCRPPFSKIQKLLTLIIRIRLEIMGDIEGIKNSFLHLDIQSLSQLSQR